MTHKIVLLAIAAALTVSIVGCAKEKGPMEKMGESMDNAAQSVEKSADEAAESVKEAIDE